MIAKMSLRSIYISLFRKWNWLMKSLSSWLHEFLCCTKCSSSAEYLPYIITRRDLNPRPSVLDCPVVRELSRVGLPTDIVKFRPQKMNSSSGRSSQVDEGEPEVGDACLSMFNCESTWFVDFFSVFSMNIQRAFNRVWFLGFNTVPAKNLIYVH